MHRGYPAAPEAACARCAGGARLSRPREPGDGVARRAGSGGLGPGCPGPSPADPCSGGASISTAWEGDPGGTPGGTGPGSGRRDRAGARRGLGYQPAAGDGEGSGRANGRPEESPPGKPGPRGEAPDHPGRSARGSGAAHICGADGSVAAGRRELRAAARRVVGGPGLRSGRRAGGYRTGDSAHDSGRAVTHDGRARGHRDLPSVVRHAVMCACRSWLMPGQEPGQQPLGSCRPARPVADGSTAPDAAFTG